MIAGNILLRFLLVSATVLISNTFSEASIVIRNDEITWNSLDFLAVPATAYEGYVCSTKGSVVGAILTVLLLQIGLVAAFWVFYRSKQRQWDKLNGVDLDPRMMHSHTHTTNTNSSFSTSPEVIFRSVYDRLSAGGRRPILIPYPNSQNSSSSHPRVDE